MLKKLVDGVEIEMTAEEEAATRAEWDSFVEYVPPQPTKAELLAQIQALAAKVAALP